ncbi:hydrolase [Gordonia phage BENtherdunthat]|uniref:Hydrolase n=1 Tax=Gordonia phage BENtherdunthat TaxID=2047830 RepID=A0A2H4PFB5_9CAUD|nr:hydrolase [Gordonia phage BENtherdunthat]ATW60819.1 hydrolase [Gordonia phage BENtherdunthat]
MAPEFKVGDRVRVVRCNRCPSACDHIGMYGKVNNRARFSVDIYGPEELIRSVESRHGVQVERPLRCMYFKPAELEHID